MAFDYKKFYMTKNKPSIVEIPKMNYTIEGNTNNMCAERMYSFDDAQVMGYGSLMY